MRDIIGFSNTVRMTARRNGEILWTETARNLMVNVGLDDVLDKYFSGSAYTASHFIGLTDGTPTFAAGDTMASHAGWAEVTAYDEAARPGYTPGAVSGQSVSNSTSKATFTVSTGGATLGGAFVATDATKGGTAGVLVAGLAFGGGDRTLNAGDTLEITWIFDASSV